MSDYIKIQNKTTQNKNIDLIFKDRCVKIQLNRMKTKENNI